MACQFNSAELAPISASQGPKGPNAAGADDEPTLDTFIQDALDLVEFANGPASSTWGAKRAAMGHSAPFNLKMIGIGNEQWGPQYLERYEPFMKAVKAKYPNMQIVSSAGPAPGGELFNKATLKLRELKAEYIDQHYYAKPDWFRQHADRYDGYPRNGSKIFAGEYAAKPTRWLMKHSSTTGQESPLSAPKPLRPFKSWAGWLMALALLLGTLGPARALQGARGAHDPSTIIKRNGVYHVWTTGNQIYQIYHITSTDLVNWTVAPTVFAAGTFPWLD